MNKMAVLNVSLRGMSMAARFLLILYIGKYFSTADLGLYGLFYTTVTLGLFLLGFDFYTYTNREVLYVESDRRLSVIRDQFVFYGFTYLVFLLPMLLVFFYDVLPLQYIYFFYAILILEHLSQEFYRLFTVLSFPVFANWLLFLRSGLWVYLLIAYFFIEPPTGESLITILGAWIAGAALSVGLAIFKLLKIYRGSTLQPMQLSWFWSGVKVCSFYFLSTIALKVIEFANRYIIEYWCDLKAVGIFTFYNQVANMINVILFTLYLMIIYPKLISAVSGNEKENYSKLSSFMKKKVLLYSFALALLLIVAIRPIIYFMNKPEYYEELSTFYILIAANVCLNISLGYHYILYAFRKDVSLFVLTSFCSVLSLALNIIFIKFLGIMGAAIALLVSYALLAVTKRSSAKRSEAAFNGVG